METTIPKLVKQSSSYKLIVPESVEEKIRYLIRKYPHTEWSGVLFYNYTGTFENNDLVITCVDIFPMDLGSAGWTSFKMTPDVSNYIAQNIELFDCETALVHSHHTMGAFFSGQDLKTLQVEGNDTNCFVSLIVDTKGTYVAAITRKVKLKREITVKDLGSSYEFFGEGEKKLMEGTTSTCKEEETIIEYYMLDVERHEVSNPLSWLDERFEKIEKSKEVKTSPIAPSTYLPFKKDAETYDDDFLKLPKEPAKQLSLFEEDTINWHPNKELIHTWVCKMITCSYVLKVDKFDLRQWVRKYMKNVYDKTFFDKTQCEEWIAFVIENVVFHFKDDTCPKGMTDDIYVSAIAQAMIDEIFPYIEDNEYMKMYYDELSVLIV